MNGLNEKEFGVLLDKCLEGSASPSEEARVIDAARFSEELKAVLIEQLGEDIALKCMARDDDAFAAGFRNVICRKGKTEVFAVGFRKKAERAAPRRKRARGLPRFVYWAAAACVLAVIGLYSLTRRPSPTGPTEITTASLTESQKKLVESAAGPRTTDDLWNLRELAHAACREELERGSECDLRRFCLFGITSSLTANPKTDGQCDDLRFLVDAASSSPGEKTALSPLLDSLSPIGVAEAGQDGGPLPADHERMRAGYAAARKAASERYYDRWNAHISALIQESGKRGQTALRDAYLFELFYVTFYERGLASKALNRYRYAEEKGELPEGPCTDYFRKLLPEIERMAERERKLESNVTFRAASFEQGRKSRWRIQKPGSKRSEVPGMLRDYGAIAQLNDEVPFAVVQLGNRRFSEAVLTCQVRLISRGKGAVEHPRAGNYVMFPNAKSNFGQTSILFEGQWAWIRTRFKYVGGGAWTITSWGQTEGFQPYDFRSVPEKDLSKTSKMLVSTSREQSLDDLPETGILMLATKHTAAEWRALSLEIIK